MMDGQHEPKAMPLKVAELIYSFLWLEFRGRPVSVDGLQKRFEQRMRCSLKEFISWFSAVKVSTGLKEYDGILFDYLQHPSREENGKKYPSYFTVSPMRNVDGMPVTGIRTLTEVEEKRLLKCLPSADRFVDITKLDFDLISNEVDADKFSVMAAAFWHMGYRRRPEPNRTLSTENSEYAGCEFMGVCSRNFDLDERGKCEIRYVLVNNKEREERVPFTLIVNNVADYNDGEIVFGHFEKDGVVRLDPYMNHRYRVVYWNDFLESERFDCLSDWLEKERNYGLFPFFNTSTRNIIILDAENKEGIDKLGRFYAGFVMDFNDKRVYARKILQSCRSDFLFADEIDECIQREGNYWSPKEYLNEDVCFPILNEHVFEDSKLWEKLSCSELEVDLITSDTQSQKERSMNKEDFSDYQVGEDFTTCIGIYDGEKDGKQIVRWTVSTDRAALFPELQFLLNDKKWDPNKDWLIKNMLIGLEPAEGGKYINALNVYGMGRDRYVEVRQWSDFEELKSGTDLEEYINSSDDISLTPKFKYKTPRVIIEALDAGKEKMYVGFTLDKDGNYKVDEWVARSEFTWKEYSKEQSKYFHVVGGYAYGERGMQYNKFPIGVDVDTETFYLLDFFKSSALGVDDIISKARDNQQENKYKWEICRKPQSPEECERQFVKDFIKYATEECGFTYDERDLIRFHTAVKCGRMTLLGGNPGCGKSKMVEIYARALCGNKYSDMVKPNDGGEGMRQTFLRVDINPAWLEPSDMMGYYFQTTKEEKEGPQYHPASCGLKEFLDTRSVGVPELICFEEMNLARIEFYFSEFIQMLSRDTLELPTYGLTLREGTRFVGTFNDDATTQRMSSRFLDRCSVIMLGDGSDDERPFALKRGKVRPREGNGIPDTLYHKWIKGVGDIRDDIVNETNDLYQKIIQGFKSKTNDTNGLNIKPSPRVREEILLYIVNRIFLDENSDHVVMAFDEAFAQRVISKFGPNPLHEKKYAKLAEVLSNVLGKESISAKIVRTLREQSHAVAMWAEDEDVVEKMP